MCRYALNVIAENNFNSASTCPDTAKDIVSIITNVFSIPVDFR